LPLFDAVCPECGWEEKDYLAASKASLERQECPECYTFLKSKKDLYPTGNRWRYMDEVEE
jgi:rubredoxin